MGVVAETAAITPGRQVRVPEAVAKWLAMAQRHIEGGRPDLALEHLAGAAIVDIQQHQQTFLAGAFEACYLADLYERAIGLAGLRPFARPADRGAAGGGNRPLRVLYVLGSVVQGQAASANVARLIEAHPRGHFVPSVLVVEEMTARMPRLGALKFPEAPSGVVGRELLERMRASLGASSRVEVLSTAGSYLDGARLAIDRARAMDCDLAVFVASPASPIQAAMAHARVAPTQVNMCIGVPLPIRGMDAIIYNNRRREREDAAMMAARSTRDVGRGIGRNIGRGIGVLGVETSGGDAASGASVAAMPREGLGVPAGVRVLVSASNALPQRMLRASFARDLARFLATEPHAWWVGIGGGDFAPVREAMRRAAIEAAGPTAGEDVLRRVRLLGALGDIRPTIKACDVLLNEYPEGGGNVVIEAMGCGVPVVAMAAGRRHAECIGAELVGPPFAIERDATSGGVEAYWALARSWLHDEESRREAARRMERRAVERLDYAAIARAYERCYERVARSREFQARATA